MRRRLVYGGLVVALVASAALALISPAGGVAGFGDVPEATFYTEAVQWMVDNDITTGTSASCFSPDDPVTRGQAAAFMWRMEGEPSAPAHPFTDINASWQQQPVAWMYANGITTGTSPSTYSPNDVLTRGQLAALLHRLAGNPTASPHPFTDVVASWQQGPVSWMATTDPVITTGTSSTTFSPNDLVTRGQLATFFWRYKGKPTVSLDSASPYCGDPSASSGDGSVPEEYLEPTLVRQDIAGCKLLDRSPDRLNYPDNSLLTGFPLTENNFPAEGTIVLGLIPIDFEDLPGDLLGAARVSEDMQKVSDWYSMVSNGKVAIEWRVLDRWVTIPRPSTDFASNRSRSDDNRLANEAFAAADPEFDFTGVQGVAFLLPLGQSFMAEGVHGFKHSQFGTAGGYASAEGTVFNYMIGGAYFFEGYKELWTYWAHEMGHMFPLPDLYDVRGQWWIGEELAIPGGPFSGFDMMANQDGPSRTLSTWLRFVMGWLSDDQIVCVQDGVSFEGQAMIAPTDSHLTGVKSVLVPIDETRILVVESRRPHSRFDCPGTDAASNVRNVSGPNWRPRSGVITYVADMTIGHGNGFQALIAPEGRALNGLWTCSAPPQLDAIMNPGDSITFEGITVEVLSSADYDTIKITQ